MPPSSAERGDQRHVHLILIGIVRRCIDPLEARLHVDHLNRNRRASLVLQGE
jgi:hypothetical protein